MKPKGWYKKLGFNDADLEILKLLPSNYKKANEQLKTEVSKNV